MWKTLEFNVTSVYAPVLNGWYVTMVSHDRCDLDIHTSPCKIEFTVDCRNKTTVGRQLVYRLKPSTGFVRTCVHVCVRAVS